MRGERKSSTTFQSQVGEDPNKSAAFALYVPTHLSVGGTVSNALGTLAVIYSLSYGLAGQIHEDDDDGLKSCFAGAFTGALYKSGAGLRKCGMAGAFGLGAAALWSFVLKRDRRISNYV